MRKANRARSQRTLSLLVSCILILATVLPISVQAQDEIAQNTLHVDGASGSDDPACGGTGNPCRTIQFAIDKAADNDTIKVAGSPTGIVYTRTAASQCENTIGATAVACLFQKRMTILGGYAAGNWTAADAATNLSIIDGRNQDRGALVMSWANPGTTALHMEGFTVRNGFGMGLSKSPGVDSYWAFGGAIMALYVSSIDLRHMVFSNNVARGGDRSSGAGGYASGGAVSMRSVSGAYLQNVTFEKNVAQAGSGASRGGYALGGGIHALSANVNGYGLKFLNNRSIGGSSSGYGDDNGARADAFGAAATIMPGSTASLYGVVAENNEATGGNAGVHAGGAFGGAFKVEGAQLNLTDAKVRFNVARGGNAQYGWLGNGGAIEGINATINLDRVVMIGNLGIGGNGTSGDRGGGNGGAINITRSSGKDNASKVSMLNCIIADNRAANGAGSRAGGGGGGAIFNFNSTVTGENCTITNNTTDGFSYGSAILQLQNSAEPGNPYATVTLRRSIVANHSGGAYNQVLLAGSGSYINFEGGVYSGNRGATVGNITGMESMIDGALDYLSQGSPNYDYHIGASSVARDRTVGTTPSVDFENEKRIDGRPDYGADEFTAPPQPEMAYNQVYATTNSVYVSWRVDATIAQQVDHYRITHGYVQVGTSTLPITETVNAGVNTAYRFANLKEGSLHNFTVDAMNAGNDVIASTGQTKIMVTSKRLQLPFVRR
ncbi:MAG: fibronectin type III domain-containing protein [Anaerolineales bacterium]|nr:fibronectin type III domain-containing protein [Anaerolineales bacterium]